MKMVLGEWAIDVNMNKLILVVLKALIHKPIALTNKELKFIRSYLEMTTTEFGKQFGVSHVAVLKWESGKNRITPALELCIRLFVLDRLHAEDRSKDEEFRTLYKEISLGNLSKNQKKKILPLAIAATKNGLRLSL